MFVSMSRTIGYSTPTLAANRGTGPMSIIWWTIGVSGIEAPAIAAIRGLQTPQQTTTRSASMSPRVVRTRRTRPPSTSMPSTSVAALTVSAPRLLRGLAHQRPGAERVDDAGAGGVEAAEDHDLVEVGDELAHLRRGQQRDRLDAPGLRRGDAPGELLHPLRRAGDLDAAAFREDPERAVLADALHRQRGHLARVVHGEDEVRRVPGRAARVGQRALVDQHELRGAEAREVVREAVADDAGADDHDLRRLREGAASRGQRPCVVAASAAGGAFIDD